jgi:hypothetical protein
LVTISYGIPLVLANNIRLNGNGKRGRVWWMDGTLRMETDATISGGVYVGSGNFTKTGGSIDRTNRAKDGSVVYVNDSKSARQRQVPTSTWTAA